MKTLNIRDWPTLFTVHCSYNKGSMEVTK